jgi:hypothetical protein
MGRDSVRAAAYRQVSFFEFLFFGFFSFIIIIFLSSRFGFVFREEVHTSYCNPIWQRRSHRTSTLSSYYLLKSLLTLTCILRILNKILLFKIFAVEPEIANKLVLLN